MCGLVGLLAGHRQQRRLKDIEALTDVFTMLLLLSEHRGPHATGVAWVKQDGTLQAAKAPLPARQFVQTSRYLDWLRHEGIADGKYCTRDHRSVFRGDSPP
ncbi:MAG: hypothetical protein BWY25_02706 [Chloroflexi bacterium ADurb.Bin222]|nr:MAG: hypothetical protein BWY25_02706 [Chloroflexi bacterium ADurb.Bin222]